MDNKANKFLIIGAVVVIVAVIIVAIVTSGKDYSSPDDVQMYNTEDGMTFTDEDGNEINYKFKKGKISGQFKYSSDDGKIYGQKLNFKNKNVG